MKDLRGEASQPVDASPEACLDLLADIEGYPRWYPEVVRAVEVLARDGERASKVRATLRAAIGPINRDLQLVLSVTLSADGVTLSRVANQRGDRERFEVVWRATGGGQTRVALTLQAALDIPRFVPTTGVADQLATGFVAAASRELAR